MSQETIKTEQGEQISLSDLLCPICGWKIPDNSDSRLSIHILYEHTADEINPLVDDGKLIEDVGCNYIYVPRA